MLNLNLRKLLHIDTSYVHDYMKVSLPVLINQALWGVAQMVQTGILGHLGGDVTAANAISVQVYQVLSVVCYGAASAAGIVVGRTIGEDNQKAASACHDAPGTVHFHRTVLGTCDFPSARTILAAFGGTLTEKRLPPVPVSSCSCSPSPRSAPPIRWRAITASSAAAATPRSARR